MNFTVRESNIIKGLAIILMFIHHTFGFPDRILPPNHYIPLLESINLEYYIALFGKVCVPIFLFISGYGISASKNHNQFKRIFSFLKIYWFYMAIFVFIGITYFSDVSIFSSTDKRYVSDLETILENAFFISSSYNGEWWFGRVYIEVLIAAMIIQHFKISHKKVVAASFILYFFAIAFKRTEFNINFVSQFCTWQIPFFIGYFLQKEGQTIERISDKIVFFAFPIISAIMYAISSYHGIIFMAPFVIIFFIRLSRKINLNFLEKVGNLSFPMWLTHTFFAYYFWQSYIFSPQYSVLVFLNLLVSCMATSYILEKIRSFIFSSTNKIFNTSKNHIS